VIYSASEMLAAERKSRKSNGPYIEKIQASMPQGGKEVHPSGENHLGHVRRSGEQEADYFS